ncbi:CcdB family protein [Phytopseudomonas dryadis]|uniref:Toxin CcdB n=1 Tax=Phytopseudomonas dryadis TaxID=2487520 RepID=A0ABY1ZE25_9GAMM|nr:MULTISPECIES: CcdB family protein [Pseudomonas]TBV08574.1 plasmid maintenance protein CcdB [Pseudomonas dryadis]TBV18942.1 plasmid maintenance protein CcdB [Pseudomonas sp. FRB 230]
MPQFAVHKNTNAATKVAVPFLLDVQSDLIAELGTRVVVPLYRVAAMKGKMLETLTPIFEIEDDQYVMMTPQLAGIAKKQLGPIVVDLSVQRDDIIAALDLLITGI